MFALAIVDTHTESVHLFRDCPGQKPTLLDYTPDNTIVWSSEVRVRENIFRSTDIPLRYNRTAISHLLCFNTSQRLSVSGMRFINSNLPSLYSEPHELNKPNLHWTFPTQTTDTSSSRLHWEQSLYLALRSHSSVSMQMSKSEHCSVEVSIRQRSLH